MDEPPPTGAAGPSYPSHRLMIDAGESYQLLLHNGGARRRACGRGECEAHSWHRTACTAAGTHVRRVCLQAHGARQALNESRHTLASLGLS